MISGAYFSGIKFIKICERRTDRETDGAARRQADRAQNIYAYECICMLRLSHTDTQTHTHTARGRWKLETRASCTRKSLAKNIKFYCYACVALAHVTLCVCVCGCVWPAQVN